MKWDLFICHASEDKEVVAGPLALALRDRGIRVWYDEFALKLGDSLRRSIDRGLAESRFGIVVLSHAFFQKEWPQYELDGLAQRETNGVKVILPIWHEISREEVLSYSPPLADRVAARTNETLDKILAAILQVVVAPEDGTVESSTIQKREFQSAERFGADVEHGTGLMRVGSRLKEGVARIAEATLGGAAGAALYESLSGNQFVASEQIEAPTDLSAKRLVQGSLELWWRPVNYANQYRLEIFYRRAFEPTWRSLGGRWAGTPPSTMSAGEVRSLRCIALRWRVFGAKQWKDPKTGETNYREGLPSGWHSVELTGL
jgi:hypothetical protein